MAVLLPILWQRFFDSNGDPLSGGKLYSYIAGTSTPRGTFTDVSGDTPNTNPVELDADGYAPAIAIGAGSYKFILTDADDVVLKTYDDFVISDSGESSSEEDASGWATHAVTDGQAAGDLVGETVDMSLYSSAKYDCEIIRGTTVKAGGQIEVQNLNGTARVLTGVFLTEEAHGVTFSVSQVGLVAQLRAETSSGPGAGTIKLSRRLVPV